MSAALRAIQNLDQQEHSSNEESSRDSLLLLATNRFCDRTEYDRLSMSQYKEAFYLLIEHVSDETKIKLVDLLAEHLNTPRQVALYMALEPLSISDPMLRNSPALGQLDMLRIIELKGEDYAAVLAARPDLGTNLVRRLRKMNSTSVQETLKTNYAIPQQARKLNEQIHFSDATSHGSEIEDKTEEAKGSTAEQETTQVTSPPSNQNNAEASLLEAAARGGRVETTSTADHASGSSVKLGEMLEHAARAGKRQAMITFIHQEVGLTLQTTLSVLEDQSGDTLAVLLSAHNVSNAQANRIMMLTFPQIGLSIQNARRSVSFYAQLDSDSSLEAVNQWPKVTDRPPQHQTYLQDTDSNRLQRTQTAHPDTIRTTEQERKTG